MNNDDMVGFLVVANENIVIGVTIETGQFILFKYLGGKPVGSQTLQVTSDQEVMVSGYRQVISVDSRSPDELFIIAST